MSQIQTICYKQLAEPFAVSTHQGLGHIQYMPRIACSTDSGEQMRSYFVFAVTFSLELHLLGQNGYSHMRRSRDSCQRKRYAVFIAFQRCLDVKGPVG
jgi:hypothetical protein